MYINLYDNFNLECKDWRTFLERNISQHTFGRETLTSTFD